MKHFVFVYGTLKRGYGNNRLIADATFVGEALTIGDHFTMYGKGEAFPKVVPEGPCFVKGELFEVNDTHMASMDLLEGHPDFYMRKEVEVSSGDNSYHAWMYVIPAHKSGWCKALVEPDDNNVCEWHR